MTLTAPEKAVAAQTMQKALLATRASNPNGFLTVGSVL